MKTPKNKQLKVNGKSPLTEVPVMKNKKSKKETPSKSPVQTSPKGNSDKKVLSAAKQKALKKMQVDDSESDSDEDQVAAVDNSSLSKKKRPVEAMAESDDSDEDEPQVKKFKGLTSLGKKKGEASSEDDDESSSEEEVKQKQKKALKTSKKDDSSEESEDEDESEEEEEDFKMKLKQQVNALKTLKAIKADDEDSDDDDDDEDEDDDDDDSEEEDVKMKPKQQAKAAKAKVAKDEDDDDEEDEDEDDDEDDDDSDAEPAMKKAGKEKSASPRKDLTYMMLCGLDSSASLPEIRNFLSKRTLPVETVSFVPGSSILVGVEPENAERVAKIIDGTQYKSSTLTAILPSEQKSVLRLADNVSAGTKVDKTKLHIRGLPREATEEHVRAMFPNKAHLVEVDMLLKRGSNVSRGMATATFTSAEEAAKGMKAANGTEMADRVIQISYNVERETERPRNDSNDSLRGQTSTLMISGLPDEINYAMIKKSVPNGVQYDLKGQGTFKRCFVKFESEDDCANAFDTCKGTKISGSAILLRFVADKGSGGGYQGQQGGYQGQQGGRRGDSSKAFSPCLAVFNLPFSAEESEIREHVEDVEKIIFPKPGMCVIKFSSTEACQDGLDTLPSVQLQGRQLRAEARDENAIDYTPSFGGRGGRGGRGRGGFGDRGGRGGRGRGGFGDRGRGRGGFGDRGRGGRGRGSFGGRGRGGFGDRGGQGQKTVFDSDSD